MAACSGRRHVRAPAALTRLSAPAWPQGKAEPQTSEETRTSGIVRANRQVRDVPARPQGRGSERVICDGRHWLQERNSGEPGEPLTLQFSPLGTAGRSCEEGGAAVGTGRPRSGQGQSVSRSHSASLLGRLPRLGDGRHSEQGGDARALELIRVSHLPPGFSQVATCVVTPAPQGGHCEGPSEGGQLHVAAVGVAAQSLPFPRWR